MTSVLTKDDGLYGRRSRVPLVWELADEGEITVWLGVEKRGNLFQSLIEHLSGNVGEAYDSLKSNLVQATKSGSGRPIPDIVNAVYALSWELEYILATRNFTGSRRFCKKLSEAGKDDDER